MFYKVYTTTTCFPPPITLVGTFSTIGKTLTTSVANNLLVGDYVYSTANNEIKKIVSITNSISYTIESIFTTPSVNEVLKITDRSIKYTQASTAVINTVDGLFNGQTFPKRTVIDIDGDIFFTISGVGTAISILAE